MEPPPVPPVRKRGRPPSHSIGDAAQDRQRQVDRARKQRQYARDRDRRARPPPTPSQLRQTDEVLEQDQTVSDPAPTLVDLGLRIQGLQLDQDFRERDRQEGLQPIEEGPELYTADASTVEPPSPFYEPRRREVSSSDESLPDIFDVLAEDQPIEESEDDTPTVPRSAHRSTGSFEDPIDIDDITDIDEPTENYPTSSHPRSTIATPVPADLPTRPRETSTPLTPTIRQRYEASSSRTPVSAQSRAPSRVSSENRSVPDWSSTIEIDEDQETRGGSEDSESEDMAEYEASPRTIVAVKIRQLLQDDFPGCSDHTHTTALQDHFDELDAEGDDAQCTPLDHVFFDESFPSVLSSSKTFLTPQESRNTAEPTPDQWHKMFTGVRYSDFPEHVCLHATSHRKLTADDAFDIDSYLGFASSLAFAKKGIKYQPTPQMRQNIQTDVHVSMDIQRDDGRERAEGEIPPVTPSQLRKIPHFMMGTMVGCESDHVGIYFLFPEIGTRGEDFFSLTRAQHTLWMDEIFLPSVEDCFPPHFIQHLPGNFEHAHSNSYANQVESRLSATQSYQSQQCLGYNIPAHGLAGVWDKILNKIATVRGGAIFRNAQIFFSAKGVKLSHKGFNAGRDLLSTLDQFMTQFERTFDTNLLYPDRVFIDIGKETCPSKDTDNRGENPGFSPGSAHIRREIQLFYVLLWRRCCLDAMMHHLWDGEPPRKGKGRQFYSVSMLHDAANLTSLPKKTSQLRQGGLVYMQLYSSVKEVIDAAKQYPFQNEGAEELALDPKIRAAAQSTARSAKRDARVLEKAYLFSKDRLHKAIEASIQKSFGVRQEYRCTLRLFRRLIEILRLQQRRTARVSLNSSAGGRTYDLRDPNYVWTLPTNIYLGFLRRNADKFATGFEWIRAKALQRQGGVPWESTKMMAMFLRCLRYSLGGHDLSRERALWWGVAQKVDRDTGTTVRRVGLGFSHTLEKYGYCWIQPRIDWHRLWFKSDVTTDVLFGNSLLRQAYIRRGGDVAAFFDLFQQLNLALDFMDDLHNNRPASQRLLEWMAHIVLRQFRHDVLESIAGDLHPRFSTPEARRELLKADHPFSYEWITTICPPERVNILRIQRTKYKHPEQLFRVLFHDGRDIQRVGWKNKAFRSLYARCRGGLRERRLHHHNRTFLQLIANSLARWHWVLPYPHARGLTETNENKRNWYSIDISHTRVAEGTPMEAIDFDDWVMQNKTWREGEPEPLPDFADWDMGQWRTWRAQVATI